eukprot:TRINITY_DN2796_c0_g1_i5.p2 TRINITY_DN2796_c0_g1~~TRINITY_DN2796_c0_g1_i5.p2  ORF type:complete len:356 (-),score=66.21 TRINITY_DN2796_c0_g1_i5:1076-2143(-)
MTATVMRYAHLHARTLRPQPGVDFAKHWLDQFPLKNVFKKGANQWQKFALLAQVPLGLLSVDLSGVKLVPEIGVDLSQKGDVKLPSNDVKFQDGKGANGFEKKQTLKLVSGAAVLPHPSKVDKGGEDAYFIANNQRAIGVADGVGGWAEYGIDPGLYSKGLMQHAKQMAEEEELSPSSAQSLLERSHKLTNVLGSSTACILVLHGSTIYASNIGDSGFIVIRDKEVIFESPAQVHQFNFPYQLGGEGAMGDTPDSAQRFELQVQQGDVIVAATDGVMDNVYTEDTATIVSMAKKQGLGPVETAERLANFAQERGFDKEYLSPFALEAQKLGHGYQGGKLDDVTVVVSYVQRQSQL